MTIPYPRLAAKLYGAPLLLLPDKAEEIERIFAAHLSGERPAIDESQAARFEERAREHAALLVPTRRTDAGYAVTDRGVAVVTMYGTTVQRASGLDAISGLSGYNTITARLDAALRDPLVRGIVLDVDSPGGETAGAFELATYVAEASKPIWAVANELAASSAYLIASAAQRLILPASAAVGSIGVVMLHQDRSQLVEKSGVRYTPIYAGAKKLDGSSLSPLTESARVDLQRRVDEVYSMFVDAVAQRRDLTADAVRATEAGILSAQDAVDQGFADEIGSLTSAITAMQAEVTSYGYQFKPRAVRATEEEHDMGDGKKDTPAAPATTTATSEQLAQERAAGAAEAEKTIAPKARAEGAAAERERVKAITTHAEATERPALAAHLAYETDMPAEQAIAMLAKAGKEAPSKPGNLLDAAMRATGNPKVGADGDPARAPGKPQINTAAIYELHNQAHSPRRG